MSLALIFATLKEADQTLSLLNAQEMQYERLYRIQNGFILISGMGSLAAAARTLALIREYPISEIWSLGLAGSFNDRFELGQMVPIEKVSKHLLFPPDIDTHSKNFSEGVFPPLYLSAEEKGASLLTSDYPHHQKSGLHYDLVDMEGYGIAFASLSGNKKCRLFKWVSDFTSSKGASLIQTHIKAHSLKMAEWVNSLLLTT